MPVTYSLDLRKRIVEKYYERYTIKEVAEIYDVSSSVVGRYLQLDDNNDLVPKKRGTKKPPRIDVADFDNLVLDRAARHAACPQINGTKYARRYLRKSVSRMEKNVWCDREKNNNV